MLHRVDRWCWALMFLWQVCGTATGLASTGTVVDATTGRPIAGAIVTAGDQESFTDRAGRYQTGAAAPFLGARAPGYRPEKVSLGESSAILLRPFAPRALYLTSRGIASTELRDGALALVKAGKADALVIDIKDDFGNVVYPSRIAAAAESGARTLTTIPSLSALVADLHGRGIYAIARIVVFKDKPFATAHPELAVRSESGLYRDREGMNWSDPFRRAAWAYNIGVAEEAAAAGFDEIQFDYVRFPDSPSPLQFAQPSNETSRVTAISGFLEAARRRLVRYNVFISADFFGYVCWNNTDTGIGQDLSAIAGAVDYLSPMLYPSGFHAGIPGYPNPVENAYEVIYLSLAKARDRLGIPPARFRPWLQAFRDYAFDRRSFDGPLLNEQIRAAQDFGAAGWMLWNAGNRYDAVAGTGMVAATDGCPAALDGKAD